MNTKILDMRSLAQANSYILLHIDKLSPYRQEFLESQQAAYDGIQISKRTENKLLVEKFPKWLANQMEAEQVDADVIALARGPHKVVSTYDGFIVNGFRVHTKKHEQHCVLPLPLTCQKDFEIRNLC
ncbi:hypothetical protein GOBAR_AA22303 [Gossypium barbadense]|uniref:Uncharacterized protein n=1 Tax=Gossypium barbadense TaxID=3634 RepID=A0A2P5X4V3_GOSBA|nr:hypothetical protein GOBAR_AA22303 [Gossypium barbadense]